MVAARELGYNTNASAMLMANAVFGGGEADFNTIAGTSIYDASFLSIDFAPTGDTLTMQVVSSSDEYPKYSRPVFDDAVGVWINGTFDITTNADDDDVSFAYTVDSVDGSNNVLESDVGFVTVKTTPCFAASTRIRTIGRGYSPAARRTHRNYEARLLLAQAAA
ncbi:MAG: choice-of-anchor L domain-containing protein [Octadecabacter sp.]